MQGCSTIAYILRNNKLMKKFIGKEVSTMVDKLIMLLLAFSIAVIALNLKP